jgi:hypothetical protein
MKGLLGLAVKYDFDSYTGGLGQMSEDFRKLSEVSGNLT